MKKIIKKKILHTVSDDWSTMKSVITITFFGIPIFKKTLNKNVSVNVFN